MRWWKLIIQRTNPLKLGQCCKSQYQPCFIYGHLDIGLTLHSSSTAKIKILVGFSVFLVGLKITLESLAM